MGSVSCLSILFYIFTSLPASFNQFDVVFQHQQYIDMAERAWEEAWQILHHDADDWSLQTGMDACKGCVHARKFHKLGKVFKLQVIYSLILEK